MAVARAAATFDLVIEQVPLDVSWEAYRTSCRLMLVDGGTVSAIAVTIAEVETALTADNQQDVKTGFSWTYPLQERPRDSVPERGEKA